MPMRSRASSRPSRARPRRRHTAASVAFPIVPPAFAESTTMTDKDYAKARLGVFGGDAIDEVRPIAPYTSVFRQFFSHSNTIPASRRTATRPASRMIGSLTMRSKRGPSR
jgi:hypothetical protein